MKHALFFATVLFAASSFGQECTVSIPLNVLDRPGGAFVSGVTTEQLRAFAGEYPLHIATLEPWHRRRLLILVDESGSISGSGDTVSSHRHKAAETALKAVDTTLNSLPEGLSVEYGLFSDTAVFGEGFFADPKDLRDSIADVNARFRNSDGHNHTALHDVLLAATRRFQNGQPGDSILLISDGEDNASGHSLKGALQVLSDNHISLSLILISERLELPVRNSQQADDGRVRVPAGYAGQQDWISAAQRSGGLVHLVDETKREWGFKQAVNADEGEIVRFLKDRLLTGYIANVQIPASWSKERTWKLSLATPDPKLKHAFLSYPDRLPVCGAPGIAAQQSPQ